MSRTDFFGNISDFYGMGSVGGRGGEIADILSIGTRDRKQKSTTSYAKIFSQILEKRQKEMRDALLKGQSLQQVRLGISDDEWNRLDLNKSTILNDEAKEEDKDAANTAALSGVEEVETIKRVLGDGSILVITTQGGKVIEQEKISPHMIAVANPEYVSPEDGGTPSGDNRRTIFVTKENIFDGLL